MSVEGRSEIGPQKGVQSLGDDLREFAVGLAGGTWVPGHAARIAEGFADRAEVVEGERDRLDAWKREALMVLERYDDLARRVVPDGRLGAHRSTLLAEHVDALTADLDRTAEAADRAAVRLREVERERDEWKRRAEAPLIDHKRCEAMRRERDDLRRQFDAMADNESRAVADAAKAEAAVERVRALLDEADAKAAAAMAPLPMLFPGIVSTTALRAALDGEGA